MEHEIKPKFVKHGEKISKVKNNVTGDIFYTSNLYEKTINGEPFVGVFTKCDDTRNRKVNWMRRDHLIKLRER
jgi:hypothetical protein